VETGAVGQVRRFNRLVTQRVGALNDRFLARGRPLAEARVLWEIGWKAARYEHYEAASSSIPDI
jgi:hypothetical protein